MTKIEIILEEKYPKKLGMGPTAKKLFQEIKNEKEVIFNFKNIEFMSRSFAQEYVFQKHNTNCNITEINMKTSIEQLLEIVNSGQWLDYQDFFEGSVDNRYLKFTNHYDYYCNYNLSDKGFNIHRKGDIMLYMAYNTSTNTLFIVEYIEK